jgi:hypothetical protein
MIVSEMAIRQRAQAPTADDLLDLGSIPVKVTPAAREALAKLPKKALKRMADALSAWAASAPVSAAKALYYVDYEDPDLKYVLVELLLNPPVGLDIDEEVEFAMKVDGDLSETYARILDALPEKDKRRLFNGLMVDLTWPDDWDYVWGDDSAASLRS